MRIEFFSGIPGLASAWPITPADSHMPAWMSAARREIRESGDARASTVARCPGIVDLFTQGLMVPCPYDIDVDSSANGIKAWVGPDIEAQLGRDPVGVQTGSGIARHIPKRPWSNASILKINTPWHAWARCKLLMLPWPYGDAWEIEACPGVLDPAISSEINIQAWVNGTGSFSLRAGQPLCLLVPMTDRSFDLVVRDANSRDALWLNMRRFINSATWVLDRRAIRRAYERMRDGRYY